MSSQFRMRVADFEEACSAEEQTVVLHRSYPAKESRRPEAVCLVEESWAQVTRLQYEKV